MITVVKKLDDLTLDELNIKSNELNEKLYGFNTRMQKIDRKSVV